MVDPLTFHRLRCGVKVWTAWLPSREECFAAGVPLGLAYRDRDDVICLGPLTWIEQGTRRYAKSRTVPVPR